MITSYCLGILTYFAVVAIKVWRPSWRIITKLEMTVDVLAALIWPMSSGLIVAMMVRDRLETTKLRLRY